MILKKCLVFFQKISKWAAQNILVKQKLCYKKQILVQKFTLVSYLTNSDISSDNPMILTNGNNKISYFDFLPVIYVNFHNRKGLIRYE